MVGNSARTRGQSPGWAFDSSTFRLASRSSQEWTSPCHGEDHGFKSHRGRMYKILILILLLFLSGSTPVDTQIDIHNPYNYSIEVELKCDWREGRFAYRNKFVLPKRGKYQLLIPKWVRKCQLWPRVK